MISNTIDEGKFFFLKKELALPSIYKWVDTGCPEKKKIFERNSPFPEHPPTMKAYPVKRLTAHHPLKGKLIQKGAVTCLSLFDCFLLPASTRTPVPRQCLLHSGFIPNSITFRGGLHGRNGQLSLNTPGHHPLELVPPLRNASPSHIFSQAIFSNWRPGFTLLQLGRWILRWFIRLNSMLCCWFFF